MTNIEAIKHLEYLQDNYTRKGALMCQAIDTAIAVLNPKPICTNADKIRQMTDDELAVHFRTSICNHIQDDICGKVECDECIISWLKKEAGNENSV